MVRTVLVPTEGSPLSIALTDYPDASVVVLYVLAPIGSGFDIVDVMRPTFDDGAPPGSVSPEYWTEWYESAREDAANVFEHARETAAAADNRVETVLEFGDPAAVIVDYGDEHDVDRIVMGSHCRSGAARFLLGSVAETVVRRASMPVMIVR